MVDLWWKDNEKDHASLFAGCVEERVAWIYRSNKGKLWSYMIEVPARHKIAQWLPYDVVKQAVEMSVRDFFDMANTPRPAMEPTDG